MNSLLALAMAVQDATEKRALAAWPGGNIDTVRRVVAMLEVHRREIEEPARTRAEVGADLLAIREHASALLALLNAKSIGNVLAVAGTKRSVIDALRDALPAVQDGAAKATDRLSRHRGRGRVPQAFGLPSNRLLCAVAAIEMLERTTGRKPSKKDGAAQRLCAALWRASAGPHSTVSWSENNAGVGLWERHLGDARNPKHGSQVLWASLSLGLDRDARDGTIGE